MHEHHSHIHGGMHGHGDCPGYDMHHHHHHHDCMKPDLIKGFTTELEYMRREYAKNNPYIVDLGSVDASTGKSIDDLFNTFTGIGMAFATCRDGNEVYTQFVQNISEHVEITRDMKRRTLIQRNMSLRTHRTYVCTELVVEGKLSRVEAWSDWYSIDNNDVIIIVDGEWYFNGEPTGIKANTGDKWTIGGDGYWHFNGEKTEYYAISMKENELVAIIGGEWYINGKPTGINATPEKPDTWRIGEDGYWYLNGKKTEHYALGSGGGCNCEDKPGTDVPGTGDIPDLDIPVVKSIFKMCYRKSVEKPEKPTGGQYDFDTNVFTVPSGWSESNEGLKGEGDIWYSSCTFMNDGTNWGWSEPFRTINFEEYGDIIAKVLYTKDMLINNGKAAFYANGSGYVAGGNITWTKDGDTVINGNVLINSINRTDSKLQISAEKIMLDGDVLARKLKTIDLEINGGKTKLNADGSGHVAGGAISWDKYGNPTIKGAINASDGLILKTQMITESNQQIDNNCSFVLVNMPTSYWDNHDTVTVLLPDNPIAGVQLVIKTLGLPLTSWDEEIDNPIGRVYKVIVKSNSHFISFDSIYMPQKQFSFQSRNLRSGKNSMIFSGNIWVSFDEVNVYEEK